MGRRKLELKLIEDKTSRQVAFSKRRIGFLKKARHLSVLCDVQVAAVVFSGRGKLYDFCSSNTSLERILERYEKSSLEGEEGVATKADNTEECHPSSPRYRTCQELLQTVERFVEEPNAEMPTVNDFVQLEEEITGALMQIRSRKTQLMMEYKRTLEAEENKLREENQQMEQQVAEAAKNGKRAGAVAGDLNNLATNQTKLPPLETLPLFPT